MEVDRGPVTVVVVPRERFSMAWGFKLIRTDYWEPLP
jgi:hypothetical protein